MSDEKSDLVMTGASVGPPDQEINAEFVKNAIEGMGATLKTCQDQLAHNDKMIRDIMHVLKIFRQAINNEMLEPLEEIEKYFQG
jgi:hypothetical protein